VVPELKNMPPGQEWLRVAIERLFVDTIPAQHKGLEQVLRDFAADVIIGDDMFFGMLPQLLGPCLKRPPIVLCGTSILHCRREDGAPLFLGLPPATTQAQLGQYAAVSQQYERVVNQPLVRRLNPLLKEFGVGPLSMPLFESVVELADAYMQMTVPSFEFPRRIPPSVHFIGALPVTPNQAPLPSWAHELDGSRKVVLVTQGTLANHNFRLLIAPTLAALANEPDLLVVVTGSRPPNRRHTWPNSQQRAPGQLFAVRMDAAEGRRICHQWWLRQC
jgi:UDP:flavonoid glycosyltransferase YjiC (YdhE family)